MMQGEDSFGELARRLQEIVRQVEEATGTRVTGEDLGDSVLPVYHVFLHELVHAALARRVPWAEAAEGDPLLDEAVEAAVVVVAASLSRELGLPPDSGEEMASALRPYPVPLEIAELEGLSREWEEVFRPRRDLAGFAEWVRATLEDRSVRAFRPGADGYNPRSSTAMIVCRSVTKTYVVRERAGLFRPGARREIEALRGVDLEVARGEFVGLLGRNGAGKTTLLKIVATLLLPTRGEVELDGIDALREPRKVRRKLGVVLAGDRTLYWKLTARENLLLFAGLHNLPRREARARAGELLERVGLSAFAHVTVEKYSTGMRKRLAIARALLHRPPLLILDEPTTGLDPHGVQEVWEVLRALRAEGTTVLMATHNMLEAERVPTRLLVVEEGTILADGTPAELVAQAGGDRTAVLLLGARPEGDLPGLLHPERDGKFALTVPLAKLPLVLGALQGRGVPLLDVQVKESGLWEAFLRLTGRPFDDGPPAKEGEE